MFQRLGMRRGGDAGTSAIPTQPAAAPGANDAALDYRLKVRERLFAFGDDFWIENARGQRAYLVDGKALRVRDTLLFKDLQGQERYKLQEKLLRVRATMTLYNADGSEAATIRKALITLFRDRYSIDRPGAAGSRNPGQHPAPRIHHRAEPWPGGDHLQAVVPYPRHVRCRSGAWHDRSPGGGRDDCCHRHDARS